MLPLRRPYRPAARPCRRPLPLRLEPLEDRSLPSVTPASAGVDISGQVNNGSAGLAGWTVSVLAPSGAAVAATTTDANGNYAFTNLPPGTYQVCETLPFGWLPVSPSCVSLPALGPGVGLSGLNFTDFQFATVAAGVLTVHDRTGFDTFVYLAGATPVVGLGGAGLPLFLSAVPQNVGSVQFTGGGGDQAWLQGTGIAETAVLAPNRATLTGPGYQVAVDHVHQVVVEARHGPAQGGNAAVSLLDSAGKDSLVLDPTLAAWTGPAFQDYATAGYARLTATSTAGSDTATLVDTSGGARFTGTFAAGCTLAAAGVTASVNGFHSVFAYVTAGGADAATLTNDSGNPVQFALTSVYAFMQQTAGGASVFTQGYRAVAANAGPGGADQATLIDFTGAGALTADARGANLAGAGFALSAARFSVIAGYAAPGTAQATLYDSPADDRFTARGNRADLYYGSSPTHFVAVLGFAKVTAVSSQGGFDVAFVDPNVTFAVQTVGNWH